MTEMPTEEPNIAKDDWEEISFQAVELDDFCIVDRPDCGKEQPLPTDGKNRGTSCDSTSRPLALSTSKGNVGVISGTNFGSVGKGERILQEGTEAVLIDHKGGIPGCLTHFWFGGNFAGVEHTRIRYYVDQEIVPSIDMELYFGHGIGFGDNSHAPWITKWMGKVGRKNGIHNNYQIPFQHSIRVTAERVSKTANNSSEHGSVSSHDNDDDDTPQSWWIIRGVTDTRVSLNGMVLPPWARLNLAKVENYTAQPLEEFNLCNIVPQGLVGPNPVGVLFQVTIAAQCPSKSLAYLEACIRAYHSIPNNNNRSNPGDNNDAPFLVLSSGLEDYFLGTYYFDSGPYHSDIAGLTHWDSSTASFSAYRFHDKDLVMIPARGLRLTCRCGETEHGSREGKAYLHPQPTTYTAYVWYYLWSDEPEHIF